MKHITDGNYICTKCQGTGKIELNTESWLPGGGSRIVSCDMCDGKGFVRISIEE